MQSETGNSATTIMGVTCGMLAGIYQSSNGGSLLHTMLSTAITAFVSCLVSFLTQYLLKKIGNKRSRSNQ